MWRYDGCIAAATPASLSRRVAPAKRAIGAYRDPAYKGATDDRANGLAGVAGISGPEKFPAIKAVLAKERHASPYLEKYVLEALFLMNEPDAAL